MKKWVRLDEPDARAAGMNEAALTEGPRAVQVVDLDLLPGAGPRGCFRSSNSCRCAAPTRMKRSGPGVGIGLEVGFAFDPDCDCDPDPDADRMCCNPGL